MLANQLSTCTYTVHTCIATNLLEVLHYFVYVHVRTRVCVCAYIYMYNHVSSVTMQICTYVYTRWWHSRLGAGRRKHAWWREGSCRTEREAISKGDNVHLFIMGEM